VPVPRFADLLVEEVRKKREELARVIGGDSDLRNYYGELLGRVWISDLSPDKISEGVYAVDSSCDDIDVVGGGSILVSRAIALSAGGEGVRKLRLDAFFPRDVRDQEELRRLMREHLEHLAGLEAVERGAQAVLIDGSLYARMTHVLREINIDGFEDFMFEYIETYAEFFREASRRNVAVVGVSKDSRSTVLKEELLTLKLRELLGNVEPSLRETVLGLFGEVKRRPREALESLRRLLKAGVPVEVYDLFRNATSGAPDSKIIFAVNPGNGLSLPLQLSIEKVSARIFELVLSDSHEKLLGLLERVFPATRDKLGESFGEKASRMIDALKSYPPIAVTYVVLEEGDDPIRVDIALRRKYPTRGESHFLDIFPEEILLGLRSIAGLYAGPRSYNVLLLEADKRVRTSRETMEMYHRLIMQELKTLVMHSRSDRRFFYP
jgi:hypothetical protein